MSHQPSIFDSERECFDCIRKAIKLGDFCSPPYFHVSYSEGDVNIPPPSPNAATAMIGRIVRNCDSLAQEYLSEKDSADWNSLNALTDSARKKLAEAELSEVLPLKTMGILPLFSTSYLAEFLDDLDEPLISKAYAVAIRRIFFEIFKERANKNETADKMHPFLLYRCAKALVKFKRIYYSSDTKAEDKTSFIANIKDEDLLKNAIEQRFKLCQEEYDEGEATSVYGMGNRDFIEEFIEKLVAHGLGKAAFSDLINYLEERSYVEALKQISSISKVPRPELDASALAFSLGVLSFLNNAQHSHIIAQGLSIIFENCDDGVWHAVMPFYADRKGRAIFVPSIEIAVMSLVIFARQYKKNLESPDVESALLATGMVQKRLFENVNMIIITHVDKSVVIEGWSTDRAPSYRRVDSWVNAHALSFLLRRFDLVRFSRKRKILDKYDWTSHEDCRPRWFEIVDTDLGTSKDGIKKILGTVLDADVSTRVNSPMFLLYGPPGTAKTALVSGLANKLGWDLLRLSPSDFVAEGPAKIESHSRDIFNDLMKNDLDKCIILMDEMDTLFRYRQQLPIGSMIEFIVPAFLPKLQRLREHVLKKRIAVFIITNYLESIDRAISRGGRIDHKYLVLPFNKNAKFEVLTKFLRMRLHQKQLWFKNDQISENGKKSINKILDNCSPFLVYREIEQLSNLICNKWSEGPPSKVNAREVNIIAGISPEIYQGRKNAHSEICSLLINRLAQDNGIDDFSAISLEEAKERLQTQAKKLPQAKKEKWDQWSKIIDKM